MNNEASGKSFLSGVTALTVSTAVVKVIGLLYKIPLMHFLGAEGMGYFNAAYELYSLFFVVATAGLPVALSIMISESLAGGRLRNVKKIWNISFSLFLLLGLLGALIMSVGAGALARFVGSPDAGLCIALIAPTVFFVAISGAVRGYFQGNQNMIPTAVSQVIEAGGKLALGLIFAVWAVRVGRPPHEAAAFAVIGLVAGSAVSMLYLLISRARKRVPTDCFVTDLSVESTADIFKGLLFLAVPVTVGASLSSLMRVADMTLILRRLTDCGIDAATASAMFGSYSTLALPVYHLPSSLLMGVSVSLVPGLTRAAEKGDMEHESRLVEIALRLCAFVSVPCALGLVAFSHPILSLLFPEQPEAVELIAPLLSLLGLSVPASCLLGLTGSVLQARKKVLHPILSMAVGMLVKVISAYILIGIPQIGLMGAAISTLLCNLTAVAVNLLFICSYSKGQRHIFSAFCRPLAAAFFSIFAAQGLYAILLPRIHGGVAFVVAMALCGAIYLPMVIKLGVLTPEDMAYFPLKKQVPSGQRAVNG